MSETELLRRTELRRELAPTVDVRSKTPRGHCEYCGSWAFGRVCRNCRDLVQKDPNKGAIPW